MSTTKLHSDLVGLFLEGVSHILDVSLILGAVRTGVCASFCAPLKVWTWVLRGRCISEGLKYVEMKNFKDKPGKGVIRYKA